MDLNDGGAGGAGGDGGDIGGVADFLGGAGDAGGGGGAGAGAGGGTGDAGAGGGDQQQGQDPAWYADLSGEVGDGDSASLRDWVKASGVKDINGLAKVARDNQKALRDSGRVKVPGEGASAAEIAEFHKAIGVPEDPKGYAIPQPMDADGNPIPLNTELTEQVTNLAHKHGAPKAAIDGMLAEIIADQVAQHDAMIQNQQKAAGEHVKGWGEQRDDKLASVNAAAKDIGLSRADMDYLRGMPSGPGKMLDMLAKYGTNFGEDALVRGEARTFGMSAEQAAKDIAAIKADPTVLAKALVPGSQENNRYTRALEALKAAANKAEGGQ